MPYVDCSSLSIETLHCAAWLQSGELNISGDEIMSDADTEEALAEFDFLVSVSRDGAGEARSHADTDWGNAVRTVKFAATLAVCYCQQ